MLRGVQLVETKPIDPGSWSPCLDIRVRGCVGPEPGCGRDWPGRRLAPRISPDEVDFVAVSL